MRPLSAADDFPLWAFACDGRLILTRGRTMREAGEYLTRYYESVRAQMETPVDGATIYGTNHAPGWLNRPMYWLCEALGLEPAAMGHDS